MALDHELPVWGVRPNWQQSIIETLEWQTDVLTSGSGAEQRISTRIAPRRTVEARLHPFENERTFVDLALHRLGRNEWMMPLWFDASKLSLPAVLAGDRIECATAFHEFADGGMAYLVGPDAFTGEAVRIAAVDEFGLSLASPLTKAWPAGTRIHPMRRGRFEEPSQALIVSRLSELTLRFISVEGNALSHEGAWATQHASLPVMDRAPEWTARQEINLEFLGDGFDPGLGKLRRVNTAGRAFRTQQFASILVGAAEQFAYRQMLYRLRGRQKAIWLSTHADDFTVAAPAATGAAQIDVEHVGFGYVGGPANGRDRILLPNGEIAQITGVITPRAGVERLLLAAPIGAPVASGARLSFVETVRLAQDSVEIEHLGDLDGAARSTLTFRAFADRRTATAAVQTHPPAMMSNIECGAPADPTPCNVFFNPVFAGWTYRVTLTMRGNTRGIGSNSLFIRLANEEFSTGSGVFYYGTNGEYIEDSVPNQFHVIDENLVYWFTNSEFDAEELLVQMQNMGGSTNRVAIQRWDQAISAGDRVSRRSEIITPGSDSTFGNGNTTFLAPPINFIATRYFAV